MYMGSGKCAVGMLNSVNIKQNMEPIQRSKTLRNHPKQNPSPPASVERERLAKACVADLHRCTSSADKPLSPAHWLPVAGRQTQRTQQTKERESSHSCHICCLKILCLSPTKPSKQMNHWLIAEVSNYFCVSKRAGWSWTPEKYYGCFVCRIKCHCTFKKKREDFHNAGFWECSDGIPITPVP